jgi:hypothetical protein
MDIEFVVPNRFNQGATLESPVRFRCAHAGVNCTSTAGSVRLSCPPNRGIGNAEVDILKAREAIFERQVLTLEVAVIGRNDASRWHCVLKCPGAVCRTSVERGAQMIHASAMVRNTNRTTMLAAPVECALDIVAASRCD